MSTPIAQGSRRALRLWLALVATSFLAAFAVYHLYSTLRRELLLQSQSAAAAAHIASDQQLRAATDSLRAELFTQLAALHLDGLAPSLRRMDDSRPEIPATFIWEKSSGLTVNSSTPGAPSPSAESLEQLLSAFRLWRAQNPAALHQPAQLFSPWQTEAHFTRGNPRFAKLSLGYQDENLELILSENRPVDPWAGYAADTTRLDAPWIFWYQLGPDEPLRGFLLDPQPLLSRLRSGLTDRQLVNQRLDPAPHQLNPFPGLRLQTEPGELFRSKQSTALLAALALALLLALVLLAAFTLAQHTRRASLEAERKTTFVAHVSHELRTPLTSIQMFADMLGAPALPGDKREKYIGHITRETSRLRTLVERLLSHSSLQQKKHQPTLEPVELRALIAELLDELTPLLSAAGLVVETQLPATPVETRTDRAALKQALLNLLENAAKYAPHTGALTLTLSSTATTHHLRVADQGPGIAPALRQTLFDPFVQGAATLTNKTPGLGLGLSIARGQLRACGADLTLVPSARGASFEIHLPS